MVAGVLALLTGPLWIHLTWILPTGWQAAAALAFLALVARPPGSPEVLRPGSGPIGRAVLAGVLIAVARLFGAAWAPFLAVAWIVITLLRGRPAEAAACFAGALLVFAAPALNGFTRTPIAMSPFLTGGMDAANGFHDGASGIEPRIGERGPWRWRTQRDLSLQVEREEGKRLSYDEASRAWYGRTLQWAATHPLQSFGLGLRKAWYTLSGYDPPSPESLLFRAQRLIPWARPLLYVVALLTGLGLAGLWAARRRDAVEPVTGASSSASSSVPPAEPSPDIAPVMALLVATLLASALYLVRSGDRLPLLLGLAGPAAWALLRVKVRPSIGITAAVLAALFAVPWFTLAPRAESAAENHFVVSTLLDRQRRPAESIAEIEKALRADPSHAAARLSLVASLARDGLFEQAAEEGDRVVAENPNFGAAWRLLTVLHQRTNNYARAAEAYERLIELDPMNPELHNNLGTLYASLGRYDDSVAALKAALAINPNYQSARVNLTEIEKRGPEGLAGAMLQTPTAGAAGNPLQQGLAAVMQSIQANDLATAERIIGELRANYGASPDVDFAAGTLAMQQGKVAEAIELYERSRSQFGSNPIFLNNLGTAYARANRMPEAIATWQAVLRIDPTNDLAQKNLAAAGGR